MRNTSVKIAILVAAAAAAQSASGQTVTLYDSQGFEGFTIGSLIGQSGFERSGGSDAQWQVQSAVAIGTKAVSTRGNATSWAFPVLDFTPAVGDIVVAKVDIAASDPTLSATDNFGFLMDIYELGGTARLTRVGLVYSNNTIVPVITTLGTTGAAGNFLLTTDVFQPNTFVSFEVQMDFAANTVDVLLNGVLVANDAPMLVNGVGLGDADLQASGTAAATTTGFFDNYVVQAVLIPEPSSLGLLAPAGLLLARRRRA